MHYQLSGWLNSSPWDGIQKRLCFSSLRNMADSYRLLTKKCLNSKLNPFILVFEAFIQSEPFECVTWKAF